MSESTLLELSRQTAEKQYARRVEDALELAVEFPKDALKGSLADLAQTLLANTEVPIEFGFMAAVTMFGIITSEWLCIENDGLKTIPNLYTVLIAPTGGKKSTGVTKMADVFMNLGTGYLTRNKAETHNTLLFPKAGSGEGLLKLFEHSKKNEENEWEKVPRSRVLLTPDEFRELLDKCRHENSTLGPEITSLFDGTVAGNCTKDGLTNISWARLAIIGCITTQSWDQVWADGHERDGGLLNRLFLVSSLPRPKVFNPPIVPEELLKPIKARLYKQIQTVKEPLPITPEGQEVFELYYNHLDQAEEEATRLETICKKLALILAVTNDKAFIDAEVASMAVSLVQYQLKVRKLLNPSEAKNALANAENKLRSYLKRFPEKSFSKRRLIDRTRLKKTIGLHIVTRALSNLVTAGEVNLHTNGGYQIADEEAA